MIFRFKTPQEVVCRQEVLCNQYENKNAVVDVILTDELADPNYYYYMVCKPPTGDQFVVPMTYSDIDKMAQLIVGTSISYTKGIWNLSVLIKEYPVVDGVVGENGLVAISQPVQAVVVDIGLDPTQLGEQELDPNLQIVYDDLLALKASLDGAVDGEEDRVAAELLRVSAENSRASAEALRVIAEANRHDGEDGEDGRGIVSIDRTAGTGAAGTTDTYTITYTDDSTSTFSVYNGANGTGAGDMIADLYDPQGYAQDIFAYIEGFVTSNAAPATHYHNNATELESGFMDSSAVTKLAGIANNANNYTHPTNAGNKHVPAGGSAGNLLVNTADGTAGWLSQFDQQNLISASETADAADFDGRTNNKCISASTINILLPNDTTAPTLAVNQCAMYSRLGAGAVTFTKDTGVTTISKADKLSIDSNCAVMVWKIAANTYWIFGALV